MSKRIAILSMTNISCSNATGSLLGRLFAGWSKEDIIQVCKYQLKDEVADQYENVVPFYDFMEKQRASDNLFFKIIAYLLRRLFFPLLFFIGNKSEILRKLQDFEVDVLYLRIVGEPFYYLKLAFFLKEKLNVPLVIHFMDDYDLHLKIEAKRNPIKFVQSKMYSHYLQKIVDISDLNFAISESMAVELKRRHKAHFLVAHNGIETADYEYFKSVDEKKSEPKRILWAGAIANAKDNQIIKTIVKAIDKINADISCQLLLNVPKSNIEIAKKLKKESPNVDFQTYQPIAEYKKLLASSTLLVIARNFDDKTRAYTQFSFHNKLPDFLSSGTPIIVIGPEWDNTVKMFKKYHFGAVITENDSDKIAVKIKEILSSDEDTSEVSKRAFELFKMEKIRSDFQKRVAES